MGKAVKKEPIVSALEQYRNAFEDVVASAAAFDKHESQGQKLLFTALERMFAFGENIRQDRQAFEAFLERYGKTLNKVTRANPYNALVELAFSKNRSKSWRSELANVLLYASETIGAEPFIDWLERDGGISGRYAEAVKHFARPAAGKAASLKSSRLAMITSELKQSRVVATALPGVILTSGFHRSLLFSEGGQTFLVHIRDEDDQNTIDKYLLELASNRNPDEHPLASRPLYPLFRALDMIAGTCKPSSSGALQFVAIWNEAGDETPVTKLRFLSDAYSFTNATVTLAYALPELEGRGQFILALSDAETFRQLFQHDCQWRVSADDQGICIVDDAKSQIQLKLHPVANYLGAKLRQGRKLGRRTRHFLATCEGMKASASNLDMAAALFKKANRAGLTADPAPRRLQWLSEGVTPEVGFTGAQSYSGLAYPFLTFTAPAAAIDPQMELSLADIAALWKTASAYGEDLAGYIADSDVADAAFCIDHTFDGGDHFEYVSPMVLGVSMARTQVCQDFRANPPPAPPSSASPPSGPRITGSSGSAANTRKPDKKAAVSASTNIQPVDPDDACPSHYSKTLQDNWRSKRLKGVAWPAIIYKSGNVFGAYINSFVPDDAEKRLCRHYDLEWQLRWWRRMTDIPVTVIASGWSDDEVASHGELNRIAENGGRIIRAPAREIIDNRRHSLQEFYDSDHDWGIIMDDDASLHHGDSHNSGASFFSEMAANDPAAYETIDVFSPFTGKMPSHNVVWRENPQLFKENHVFDPYYDLKGSMYIVRNFPKLGRPEILPPASFRLHGEDTLFGVEAISKGASVYRCNNIVLRELRSGGTLFPNRAANMKIGNTRIAEMYADKGLSMAGKHLLDRSEMLRMAGRAEDKHLSRKAALESSLTELLLCRNGCGQSRSTAAFIFSSRSVKRRVVVRLRWPVSARPIANGNSGHTAAR
ncbi:hypothetical protein JVX98_27110 [Ensifer sp. PDNC004]|uniref:hypothetical protein n=1 Tax=Ensifer sp. PDNC004 TaxID=2811423 RepID=UPI001965A0BA|nr:hypothetical protein [Ensifer sp. PDNC004]QRY67970.1 hypothetical protein JVX98_27110 [Ensifer sp. PDNC004]